jgi:hypothetical protein
MREFGRFATRHIGANRYFFNGPLVPHELGSFCAVRALHGVPSLET